MRLVHNLWASLSKSPEEVFASKYEWLLQWAMHFSQKDIAVAEDLVQETFVKLLVSWKTLRDLDNIEPLLYSYLKYSHLTELRRSQNHSPQSLSAIEFETLPMGLRTAKLSDQIELQDELRRIVAFLLWRKSSAKFASIFLLRFFHGYFPEEIMLICMITRHAVDLNLRHARGELKSYLADPNRIQILHRSPPPKAEPSHIAVSADQFIDELRGLIFSAPRDSCLPFDELEKRYQILDHKPLDSELLAHIVSCQLCLDVVSRLCGLRPGSKRSPWDSLGPAPRSKSGGKRSPSREKHDIKRVIEKGLSRLREIYEHRPLGLMIALNGEVVAQRDISSPRGVLKIETHAIDSLELVEVISEQGLTLLALPVLNRPPEAPPEITHEVKLSEGRTVALLLRFTADGAVIEVTYDEPQFTEERVKGGTLKLNSDKEGQLERKDQDDAASNASSDARSDRQRRWWQLWFRLPHPSPLVAIAVLLVILVTASLHWINAFQHRSRLQPHDFLENAAHADSRNRVQGTAGVIYQKVRLDTEKRTIQRDLYRDIQERRRPKEKPLDPEEHVLKARLNDASVDWNNPLSATDYKAWHDHLVHRKDAVEKTGKDLLTLITTSSDGPVQQESLTVRAADFHAVERSVQFHDQEVVEIAELAYEVMPWNRTTDQWFDAVTPSGSTRTAFPSPSLHLPPPVTEAELDQAELESLLILQELHADKERIQLVRTRSALNVEGVVETDERKQQLNSRLQVIPHVVPRISSYRDLDTHQSTGSEINSVASVSADSQPSPIDKYCDEKGWGKDDCRRASYDLLDSSTNILQESRQIAGLLTKFSSDRDLTLTARSMLDELIIQHAKNLIVALQQQESTLATVGSTSSMSNQNVNGFDAASLVAAAQHDLDLSKEMTYAVGERSRPAESIFTDLARSVAEIKATAEYIPKVHPSASIASSNVPIHQP